MSQTMFIMIVHQHRFVTNTNDPKNNAGSNFPPQNLKNSNGFFHKDEIKTEWKQNQWNRTHFIKISNTSTIKTHHCARLPLDK